MSIKTTEITKSPGKNLMTLLSYKEFNVRYKSVIIVPGDMRLYNVFQQYIFQQPENCYV
jgi:hypothetical protein